VLDLIGETIVSTYRYNVSLRLTHPTADPDTFSAALGLEPRFTDIAGQPRVRKGKQLDYVAKETYWTHQFDASHSPIDVEAFLLVTARRLASHKDLFSDIRSAGGRIEFFVGFFPEEFNCGFELTPELQQLCADLGIALAFDVYGFDSGQGKMSN
tara:strand:+ start:12301 stop:12765 length:465 start_codon:yes stop_codon:yes gene_type:complete